MIKQITIVLAEYCPHCVPFSLQNTRKMAETLQVPVRVLDIEISEQEKLADELIEKHGDWAEDYLIPQVFIEYTDGHVDHVLTGFSEAVSVTEKAWEGVFSSEYYQTLIRQQARQTKLLNDFVEKHLNFQPKCRRHCDENTSFAELYSGPEGLVGAYVCPDGYVSKVISFSINSEINWFKNFLTSQIGAERINPQDLRPATRHGWDLGNDASLDLRKLNPKGQLTEVYWTRYPRKEEERSWGVFLCHDPKEKQGCNRLFVQDINASAKLCPECR